MCQWLRKITRTQDESGANRQERIHMAQHRQEVADKRITKDLERREKQAQGTAGYFPVPEITLQLKWHKQHGVKDAVPQTESAWAKASGGEGSVQLISEPETKRRLKEFKKVLRVAMPSNENYKFVNFQFRNEVLGKHFVKVKEFKELFDISGNCENSIFVHFAKGAIQGKYKENDVFLGLVKAMTQKIDCDERGVGMQNSHYAPAWDEFSKGS
ncbi:hypothetical protein C8R41DRAFT_905573 [Lentinula lateritia]|uniref:Uncharacterized protein n=1 Tax=Lentinula lateritia TaxID=40482 RepID=A0ABQ8V3Q8_9AGAR|nr:hypothetical protein C8R41DRAFT_905573 [Lentinula lateritia]